MCRQCGLPSQGSTSCWYAPDLELCKRFSIRARHELHVNKDKAGLQPQVHVCCCAASRSFLAVLCGVRGVWDRLVHALLFNMQSFLPMLLLMHALI